MSFRGVHLFISFIYYSTTEIQQTIITNCNRSVVPTWKMSMEEIVRKATHGLRMRLTEITDRRRKSLT